MKRIVFVLPLIFILISCWTSERTWTCINNSSKDLNVYYTEDTETLYALESNSTIEIDGYTWGSIYAKEQPYSVSRSASERTVTFSDKTLKSYKIYNRDIKFDVTLTYIETDGTEKVETIAKASTDSSSSYNYKSFSTYDSYSVTYTNNGTEHDASSLVLVETE